MSSGVRLFFMSVLIGEFRSLVLNFGSLATYVSVQFLNSFSFYAFPPSFQALHARPPKWRAVTESVGSTL